MTTTSGSAEPIYHLVYKTTNLLNGFIYIGIHSTKNIDDGYLGSGKKLWEAIEKDGIENFSREILFQMSSREEIHKKEEELVDESFLSRSNIYNIAPGGGGSDSYYRKLKTLEDFRALYEEWRVSGDKIYTWYKKNENRIPHTMKTVFTYINELENERTDRIDQSQLKQREPSDIEKIVHHKNRSQACVKMNARTAYKEKLSKSMSCALKGKIKTAAHKAKIAEAIKRNKLQNISFSCSEL